MSHAKHTVTADPQGFFSVLSGNSGKTYRVTPLGGPAALCECEAFRFRGECSHIEAVWAFADETLKAWAEAMVATREPVDPFQRIRLSEELL